MIPVAAPLIGDLERAYVLDALRSGWVSSTGPYIGRFEEAFARSVGVAEAVSTSSGTAALHLTLHALGIGPGDEVIIPDLTFVATANAVLMTGAEVVLVDVEPDTACMDLQAVEQAISSRTKAIIPVHLFGQPAEMWSILALCRARGIHVIEDAAEAQGATIGDRHVGSLGDAAAFSFYANKMMTTGEGGMITTDDADLARRCRSLRHHGMSPHRRYFHSELAFNYALTNLQAALGLAQLERMGDFIAGKRQIFAWYRDVLGRTPGLTLNQTPPGVRSVFWMVSILLGDEIPMDRDEVCERLRRRGIETRPFFVPMSELPYLKTMRRVGVSSSACLHSARLGARGFNLPSGCGLSRSEVEYVAGSLQEIIAEAVRGQGYPQRGSNRR